MTCVLLAGAVTPDGRVPVESVTFPVKFVRLTPTVMVCAVPPAVNATAAGARLPIAILLVVPPVPVPVRLKVCGLLGALSYTVTVPIRLPLWVGVKVNQMAQVWPAAIAVPTGQLVG
jgi:hypothetical protein